jgi:hypothetical protein
MATTSIKIKTYRFTFSDEMINEISYFSKIHEHDERTAFKEAWTEWSKHTNIQPLIQAEINKLSELGYKGDVLDKLFKSARYYYRKKKDMDEDDNDIAESTNKQKKYQHEYGGFSRDILAVMDKHIMEQIGKIPETLVVRNLLNSVAIVDAKEFETKQTTGTNTNIIAKPSKSYEHFCETCRTQIACEIRLFAQTVQGPLDPIKMSNKFKKTYKNRFYNIRQGMSNE